MSTINLIAPAKVNFVLNIIGRRDDGFHELETVMQAIDLHDDVEIQWERQTGAAAVCACGGGCDIQLDPGRADLPAGPKNLAYKAAFWMHNKFHREWRESVKIRIVKRIPVAAGMAGGSANGAAVLYGLAKLWGLTEDKAAMERVYELAAEMGSDVPFCLAVQEGRRAALGTGRGEKLEFIEPLECRIETVTPSIAVSTAKVYGALTPDDYKNQLDVHAFINAKTLEEKCALMGNHLQAPATRMFPKIQKTIDELSSNNDALITMQSGSGPTVFSVFRK